MKKDHGTFIVIEGTDGSGKGTQWRLLVDKLRKQGYRVAEFDFPRYDEPSSYFVKEYLNGRYGSADEVGPYTASLFYAMDRYQAAPQIRAALDRGEIVIANRYVGSNMAHQGTKFGHPAERRGYFIWLDNLEFQLLNIPRPTMSFVLRVPAETAQKLVDQKAERGYTTAKRDIHEADIKHLERSVEVYDNLCKLFPRDFTAINCTKDDELMSIESISEQLWKHLMPILPTPESTRAADSSAGNSTTDLKPAVQLVEKLDNGSWRMTPDGRSFLQNVVTNMDGDVYAFTDKMAPLTIAAAMARLSRRGDDMRITLLDEFANAEARKDQKLIERVISAYGDDSVQQLVGQHFVVENASNLLTKKLEWGRLAAYLEQSTRYIYFDQKDTDGNYRYFTPPELDQATSGQYRSAMNSIFDNYSELVRKLTDYVRHNDKTPKDQRDVAWQGATRAQACDAARPMLPVATKATVGIFASGQALESLIMHLLSDDLPEARVTGEALLEECRKVIPSFLERADKPERGGATIAYRANSFHALAELAEKHAPAVKHPESDSVTLTDVWPKNELDLLADMLYEHTNMSKNQLRAEVSTWAYSQKLEVFRAYMGERLNRRHRPGRALEQAHYSFDLVCDYGIFRDLQRHRMVDDMNWQRLSPGLGYEVPALVEEAGLSDLFNKAFDTAEDLYGQLQSKGYTLEAQYATLLGHKMRWKVTYNAREAFHFHELRTAPQGHPGYRKLVAQMHDKVAEVHPLLAEAMKFVNKDEDPELTRLAAERYTQFKLQQL